MVSTDEALKALESIQDAGSGRSLLDLGWINQLRLQQGRAVFQLALPAFAQGQRERIVREARSCLNSLMALIRCKLNWAPPPKPKRLGQRATANCNHPKQFLALPG